MDRRDQDQRSAEQRAEAEETVRLFGRRLEQQRRAQGTTRAELCERSGVSEDDIAQIECGQANPTIDTMIKLADGVGKETWELVGPPQ